LLEPYFVYLGQKNFHDITTGNNSYAAGPGYDYCTGVGSPISMAAL
jgi:kumamolisin